MSWRDPITDAVTPQEAVLRSFRTYGKLRNPVTNKMLFLLGGPRINELWKKSEGGKKSLDESSPIEVTPPHNEETTHKESNEERVECGSQEGIEASEH